MVQRERLVPKAKSAKKVSRAIRALLVQRVSRAIRALLVQKVL